MRWIFVGTKENFVDFAHFRGAFERIVKNLIWQNLMIATIKM